jgi:hypothetical protein
MGRRANYLGDFSNKSLLGVLVLFSSRNIVYSIYNIAMITLTLQQERARILEQIAQIDQMIRGHLSQQTYQLQRQGQTVTQGPYYLLQRRENGKNNCQRVSGAELQVIVQGVEAHKRFTALTERYAALTERMTWQKQTPEIKKKFRQFWRLTSPRRRSW